MTTSQTRPSLDGPRAKLERAREHARALDTEVREFLRSRPYRAVHEVDPSNGDHVWRVMADRPVPMRLSTIVGDAIHNLRSCLDHLVWQLSLLTTTTPYARAEFPIYDVKLNPTSNECFDKRGRQKIRDVPNPAQEIIESMQPYHGRDWPDLVFKLIHEVNNTDKHRIVLVPAPNLGAFSVPFTGFQTGGGPALPVGLSLTPSGKNCDEVLRLSRNAFRSPGDKERVQLSFDVAIQTSETGKRSRDSARDMVDRMCITLGDYILPEFDRFFTTHGPGF